MFNTICLTVRPLHLSQRSTRAASSSFPPTSALPRVHTTPVLCLFFSSLTRHPSTHTRQSDRLGHQRERSTLERAARARRSRSRSHLRSQENADKCNERLRTTRTPHPVAITHVCVCLLCRDSSKPGSRWERFQRVYTARSRVPCQPSRCNPCV